MTGDVGSSGTSGGPKVPFLCFEDCVTFPHRLNVGIRACLIVGNPLVLHSSAFYGILTHCTGLGDQL